MSTHYNNYGVAAKEAAFKGGNPLESWKRAVKGIFKSKTSQKKGCPKSAFLGLCEEGLVKGIPKGKYTISKLNKAYALTGIVLLKEKLNSNLTIKELWELVTKKLDLGTKSNNSQMDVVLALWEHGLIDNKNHT